MENNKTKESVTNDKEKVSDTIGAFSPPDAMDGKPEQVLSDQPDPRTFFWGSRASPPKGHRTARMPVEKDALYYNMEHKNRGIAIILNHELFEVDELDARNGTHEDKQCLEHVLTKLGFEVWTYTDLTFDEVHSVIRKAAAIDHTDNDCLLLAVLSHGGEGILYAKDAPYDPELLWTPFTADKCPSLAGKPKLFFIQACRGDNFDGGVELSSRTETDGSLSYRIPLHSDFLIAYSTVPGFYSWRDTTKGSWFVQALCEELKDHAFSWDLTTILTSVLRRVATDYECNLHRQKQMPCITVMLIRLLVFKPKHKNIV